MEEVKSVFTSKTLWFNVAAAVLGVFQTVAETQIADPTFQMLLVTLVNFGLRFVTSKPVSISN